MLAAPYLQRGVAHIQRRVGSCRGHRSWPQCHPPLQTVFRRPQEHDRHHRAHQPVSTSCQEGDDNEISTELSLEEIREQKTRQESIRRRMIGRRGSEQELGPAGVFATESMDDGELSAGRRGVLLWLNYAADRAADRWGRLLYQYYNWRTSVWSDLQIFLSFNVVLILVGGIIKGAILDPSAGSQNSFFQDIYQVIKLTLGEDLADNTAPFGTQVFTVIFALTGLVSFALVLALVEQVILSLVQANVTTGGFIYEKNHIVIMAWGQSQRDIESIWTILRQLCKAYSVDGGRTIVVLTQQPKLEIEDYFRRTIPPLQRGNTKFVFRQGSPLMPEMLFMINVTAAASVVIIADSSRKPSEADAQSLRAAVLIDEVVSAEGQPSGTRIVLELRGGRRALALAQYACSDRVFSVPTTQMNARGLARAVAHPMLSELTKQLWSFSSESQGYLDYHPQLAGKTFGDLAFYFNDAIVIGLVSRNGDKAVITPPLDTMVTIDDEIFLMRPSTDDHKPMLLPVQVDTGDWELADYLESRASVDEDEELTMSVDASVSCSIDNGTPLCSPSTYTVPAAFTTVDNDEQRILICGWGETSFMCQLLGELDRGPVSIAPGSKVTLFNLQTGEVVLTMIQKYARLQNIEVNHLLGDPLDSVALAGLNFKNFTAAIVLCDATWADPDEDSGNGIDVRAQLDFLRLDSMIMMVQINIRQILQEQCPELPEINIVCEKVAYEGVTRFEDRSRLPLGTTVNLTSQAAKLLSQTCYNPRMMLSLYRSSGGIQFRLQECGAFAAVGEELTFWQLQKRVQKIGEALIGWFEVPFKIVQETPIEVVINPCGSAVRSGKRIWNNGDGRMRLYTVGSGATITLEREPEDRVESSIDDYFGSAYSRMPLF